MAGTLRSRSCDHFFEEENIVLFFPEETIWTQRPENDSRRPGEIDSSLCKLLYYCTLSGLFFVNIIVVDDVIIFEHFFVAFNC